MQIRLVFGVKNHRSWRGLTANQIGGSTLSNCNDRNACWQRCKDDINCFRAHTYYDYAATHMCVCTIYSGEEGVLQHEDIIPAGDMMTFEMASQSWTKKCGEQTCGCKSGNAATFNQECISTETNAGGVTDEVKCSSNASYGSNNKVAANNAGIRCNYLGHCTHGFDCTCANGTRATGAACTTTGAAICTACASGYALEDKTCHKDDILYKMKKFFGKTEGYIVIGALVVVIVGLVFMQMRKSSAVANMVIELESGEAGDAVVPAWN